MWGCVWRCGLKVTIYPDSPRMLISRRSFYLDKVQRPTSSLHQFSLPAGLDVYIYNPKNTKPSPSAGLILVRPNIEAALGGRLALAGNRTKVQKAYIKNVQALLLVEAKNKQLQLHKREYDGFILYLRSRNLWMLSVNLKSCTFFLNIDN